MSIEAELEKAGEILRRVEGELAGSVVGYRSQSEEILIGLLCGGHLLLEGVPGIGKTLIMQSLAAILGLNWKRIQFTPDLMPADLLGTEVLIRDDESLDALGSVRIRFREGPVFTNLLLADEINRGTPKTQSALLQAMQEREVSLGLETRRLPEPFFVLATQNPIEMEGTYPLPEAQLDRFFFKITLPVPDRPDLEEILHRTTGTDVPESKEVLSAEELLSLMGMVRRIPVAPEVVSYAAALVLATHQDESVRPYIRYGASPRAAQSLVLAAKARALTQGRLNASFEDIRRSAAPALRHRIILSFEGEAEGIDPSRLIQELAALEPRKLIEAR